MKKQRFRTVVMTVMVAAILTVVSGHANAASGARSAHAPMTPQIAAKKEMVRKQEGQRVSDLQRRSAADSLKAERKRVYLAKQLTGKTKPEKIESK